MKILVRLANVTAWELRARAEALGCDQSEVARRAMRRHRREPCSATVQMSRATRSGSMPVHLDLGDTADGLKARDIREALTAQLAATADRVTWAVCPYQTVDEAEGRE